MKYILTFLVFPIFVYSQKQDFIAEYKKICENYFNYSSIEVHSTLNMYAGHEGKELISSSRAVIKLKNKEIHQQIENIITIVNQSHMIQIDKDDKYIILDRTPKSYYSNLWSLSLDQNKEMIEDISLIKNTSKEKSYSINFLYGEVEKSIISFNPSTFQLIGLKLFYAMEDSYFDDAPERKDKARLEITFEFKPQISSAFYTIKENPFCTFTADKLLSKAAYKNFEVIDNRIKY